jgi:hypothetical protein
MQQGFKVLFFGECKGDSSTEMGINSLQTQRKHYSRKMNAESEKGARGFKNHR